MKRVPLTTIFRDLLPLIIGAFGIVHQELTQDVNVELLTVYMALLGVPTATNVIVLLKGKRDELRADEDEDDSFTTRR